MSKILVGRDKPKEVNIGVTVSSVAQVETENAETKEELAEEAVEDEQMVAAKESDVSPKEAKAAPVKGRGKKRVKA